MDILPAIDLRDGKVVRLAQGDYDRQTVYSDRPADVARRFAAAGAAWVHIVDLDAARSGVLTNLDAIMAIREAVDCGLEVGGGARDDAAISRLLSLGADRVVVGSAAVKRWSWFESLLADRDLAGKLALDLAARDGLLTLHGWTETSELRAVDLAARVKGSGLGAIVYTDVLRDGVLTGPNLDALAGVVAATDVPVIASGGMSSLDDLTRCRALGCGGAIIGRAYYEGKINIEDALALQG